MVSTNRKRQVIKPVTDHHDWPLARLIYTVKYVTSHWDILDGFTRECHQVSMWVGFMSKYYVDNLPQQVVRYLPITGLDVIQETLVLTQPCAQECRQPYGVVSYDLNAAKPAMQMQATEKPKYDNVFIMPGVFHVEMTFFKALGKMIEDSGGPTMLIETDVLATGSLNDFLSGKHFNRCKRLHPILGLALEILHFQVFIDWYDEKDELKAMTDKLSLTR